MILQALYEYYQRKAADTQNQIPKQGWEFKEIPYIIVISENGEFVEIQETTEGEGRKRRARKFLVPQSVKRTVGIKAYLLWDNIEYALGANPRQREDITERHNAFKERIEKELGDFNLPSINALLKFLNNDPVTQITNSGFTEIWNRMLEENPFIAFKIDGYPHATICDDIMPYYPSGSVGGNGICLITGKSGVEIARLHPDIKGVRGANTKGAALVSFNLAPFNSYYKKQNYNAPISEEAAFAYTTALNILLGKDSQNKTTVADTTIVFWAGKKQKSETEFDLESEFKWFITDPPKDDPDRGVKAVKGLYDSINTGRLTRSEERFYVFGLAPNAARLSVRFFRQGTIAEFGEKIKQHFDDFAIVRSPQDPEFLSLYRILTATALQYKNDNVPPNLAGAMIESILDGRPYPRTLLQQCIRRIRAEQHVTRTRAAILKATINRFNRFHNQSEKEITMALDPTNTNIGYRLGRLFAVLEKIQIESAGGEGKINSTIRDRFYGAASTSPVAVFSQLLKLKNHHLAKLDNPGKKVNFEKMIGEIMSGISEFPAHLTLQDQAYFSVGYYHQRQKFFDSKKSESEVENS